MDNIVVKKSYFDNIETAIESLNSFFSSNFKKKDFPDIKMYVSKNLWIKSTMNLSLGL